jgi:hypothetical protein
MIAADLPGELRASLLKLLGDAAQRGISTRALIKALREIGKRPPLPRGCKGKYPRDPARLLKVLALMAEGKGFHSATDCIGRLEATNETPRSCGARLREAYRRADFLDESLKNFGFLSDIILGYIALDKALASRGDAAAHVRQEIRERAAELLSSRLRMLWPAMTDLSREIDQLFVEFPV